MPCAESCLKVIRWAPRTISRSNAPERAAANSRRIRPEQPPEVITNRRFVNRQVGELLEHLRCLRACVRSWGKILRDDHETFELTIHVERHLNIIVGSTFEIA